MLEAIAESHTFDYGPPDKLDTPLASSTPPTPSPSWPNQRRSIQFYNKVESLALDTRDLYWPLQRNNPLFDSICLESSSKGIILWVFQMTIAKEHGGAVSGFTVISMIVQKIQETLKAPEDVEVKFVLVAPDKVKQVVKWNFPKEWGFLRNTSVYVQYLDVSLHNYDLLLKPLLR